MKSLQYMLALCVMVIYGCTEESIPATNPDLEAEYYPLSVDRTWIYSTDSIVYNKQFGTVDTLRGFIKEQIISSDIDTEGDEVYIIDRSFRRSDTLDWIDTGTYTATISDKEAIRTEENLRFVSIVLPPKENQNWEATKYFDENIFVNINGEQIQVYRNWSSKLDSINSQLTVNGITYENVLSITHADSESTIEKRYTKELYAKDIGLIYKEMLIIDSQIMNGQPIEDRAEKGFILKQTLIETY